MYRLKPPTALKLLLRGYREALRVLQNEAIWWVNQAYTQNHPHLNEFGMYRLLGNNGSTFVKRHPFLKDCPSYARRSVIKEVIANRKAILTNHANLPANQRSRRMVPDMKPINIHKDKLKGWSVAFTGSASIEVRSDPLDSTKIAGLKLRTPRSKIGRLNVSEYRSKVCLRGQRQRRFLLTDVCPLKGKRHTLPSHWSIKCRSDGRWYLHLCYELVDKQRFEADQAAAKQRAGRTVHTGDTRITVVDPGIRTPFTAGQMDGRVTEIGDEDDRRRLRRLRHRSDELQSKLNRLRRPNRRARRGNGKGKRGTRYAETQQERRRLQHKRQTVLSKLANLIKEVHCRVAHWMIMASDIIIMPRMEVLGMIRRRRSKLSRELKRELLCWGHAAFVNRLAVMCHDIQYKQRFPHRLGHPTTLLIQPEGYTSKTCAGCGHINDRLGALKWFRCPSPSCTYEADRDHNGAFNMAIKAIRG